MKKLSACLMIILLSGIASAQQEDIKMESSEETVDTLSFSKDLRLYNKIIRAEVEELKIFKIDLFSPSSLVLNKFLFETVDSTYISVKFFEVSYEQKILAQLSWTTGVSVDANVIKGFKISNATIYGGFRYYYNLKRRIIKGKSANNFSANYFANSLAFRAVPQQWPGTDHKENYTYMSLAYGIQRRIGRLGYMDFIFGFQTDNSLVGIEPLVQFEIGIAF